MVIQAIAWAHINFVAFRHFSSTDHLSTFRTHVLRFKPYYDVWIHKSLQFILSLQTFVLSFFLSIYFYLSQPLTHFFLICIRCKFQHCSRGFKKPFRWPFGRKPFIEKKEQQQQQKNKTLNHTEKNWNRTKFKFESGRKLPRKLQMQIAYSKAKPNVNALTPRKKNYRKKERNNRMGKQ